MTVIMRDVYLDCLMKAIAAELHGWIGDSSGVLQTGVMMAMDAFHTSNHQTLTFVLLVRGYPP
jgi:hypothetical protein